MAKKIKDASELWELEHHLTQLHRRITVSMTTSTPRSYLSSRILFGKASSSRKACMDCPKTSSVTFASTRRQLESQIPRVTSEIARIHSADGKGRASRKGTNQKNPSMYDVEARYPLPFDLHEWVAYRLHFFESTSVYRNMIVPGRTGEFAFCANQKGVPWYAGGGSPGECFRARTRWNKSDPLRD